MAKKEDTFLLQLATLHQYSGDVTSDFDSQLAGIVADCRRRPSCTKARKVVITIEGRPNEQDGADVDLGVEIKSSLPCSDHGMRRARSTNRNQLLLDFEQYEDGDEELGQE